MPLLLHADREVGDERAVAFLHLQLQAHALGGFHGRSGDSAGIFEVPLHQSLGSRMSRLEAALEGLLCISPMGGEGVEGHRQKLRVEALQLEECLAETGKGMQTVSVDMREDLDKLAVSHVAVPPSKGLAQEVVTKEDNAVEHGKDASLTEPVRKAEQVRLAVCVNLEDAKF